MTTITHTHTSNNNFLLLGQLCKVFFTVSHVSLLKIFWSGLFPLYICVWACPVSSVISGSLQALELWPTKLLYPWNFPGKDTGVGFHALLQGTFLIQGSNPCLLHCRWILYHWATGKAWFMYEETKTVCAHLKQCNQKLQSTFFFEECVDQSKTINTTVGEMVIV